MQAYLEISRLCIKNKLFCNVQLKIYFVNKSLAGRTNSFHKRYENSVVFTVTSHELRTFNSKSNHLVISNWGRKNSKRL